MQHILHRFLFVLAAMTIGACTQAQTYDVASDFSTVNNPNSVWSYGYSNDLASSITTYSGLYEVSPGFLAWNDSTLGPDPFVGKNTTSSDITYSTINLPAGKTIFHPGPNGQYSEVTWTAPDSAKYRLKSAFTGYDTFGTTTDVHVLKNGVSLFDADIVGYQTEEAFSADLILQQGDVLSFAVGYGPNQDYGFDSTGIAAHLTNLSTAAVPESGTMAMCTCLFIFGAPLFIRSRKAKQSNA